MPDYSRFPSASYSSYSSSPSPRNSNSYSQSQPLTVQSQPTFRQPTTYAHSYGSPPNFGPVRYDAPESSRRGSSGSSQISPTTPYYGDEVPGLPPRRGSGSSQSSRHRGSNEIRRPSGLSQSSLAPQGSVSSGRRGSSIPNIRTRGSFGGEGPMLDGLRLYIEADERVGRPLMDSIIDRPDIQLDIQSRFPPGLSTAGSTMATIGGLNVKEESAYALTQRLMEGHGLHATVSINPASATATNKGAMAHIVNHEMSLHLDPIVHAYSNARDILATQGEEAAYIYLSQAKNSGLLSPDRTHAALGRLRPNVPTDPVLSRMGETHNAIISVANEQGDPETGDDAQSALMLDVRAHRGLVG